MSAALEMPFPTLSDDERERLIEAYRVAVELEPQRERKLLALIRMQELIGGRSSQQVARMERERGISMSGSSRR